MRKCAAKFLVLVAVLLVTGPVNAVLADDDDDHDLARRLLGEGRIKPLAELVELVKSQLPGEMLEVEFESENGVYVYEFKILRPDGKVQEVEVDAATGNVRKLEDKVEDDD